MDNESKNLWNLDPKKAARLAYLELQVVWSGQTQFSGIPDFENINCEDEDDDTCESVTMVPHFRAQRD